MEPLVGGSASQAKFDSAKFTWLGSMNNEVSGFFIRQPGPASTLEEIIAGRNLQVGSTGAGLEREKSPFRSASVGGNIEVFEASW